MTEDTTSLSFQKSTRTGTQFMKRVSRVGLRNIETIRTYQGYLKTNSCSYINDFVRHRSYISKNLSSAEILFIHENNANMISGYTTKESNHHNKTYPENELYRNLRSNANSTEKEDLTTKNSDVLFDKFQVPQEEEQKRHEAYVMKSKLLYYCLSYEIGTFKLIKFRQKLFRKLVTHVHTITFDYGIPKVIGSKAEGFNMEESDLDILNVFSKITAYEITSDESACMINEMCKGAHGHDFTYCSTEKGVYPGYVVLRKCNRILHSSELYSVPLNTNDCLVSSIHGPAILQSELEEDIDMVLSIRSPDWPKTACDWKTRHRKFGWPSEEMIINITEKGCHIVPVGSERNHGSDIEWRLSFCEAEIELVLTFNHPQMLTYGLLKLVLKEIINKNNNVRDLISSYFLKTVMFWVIEETPPNIWHPKNIIYLFNICFSKLIQFVRQCNCPNYFIPSNDMLKHRLIGDDQVKLLKVLLCIENSKLKWMYLSKSMRPFANYLHDCTNSQRNHAELIRLNALQKKKIDAYLLIQHIVLRYRKVICEVICCSGHMHTIKDIFTSIPSFTFRQKILPFLAYFLKTRCPTFNNKISNALQKFKTHLIVTEAFSNVSFGKVILALHFYEEREFKKCLTVSDSMLDNMEFCIRHNRLTTKKYENLFSICLKCSYNENYLKYFFTSDIRLPATSHLISNDIYFNRFTFKRMLETVEVSQIIFYPECFVHFLRCLCFVKLGDSNKADDAYLSLSKVEYVVKRSLYEVMNIATQAFCHSLSNGATYSDELSFVSYVSSHLADIKLPNIDASVPFLEQLSQFSVRHGINFDALKSFLPQSVRSDELLSEVTFRDVIQSLN